MTNSNQCPDGFFHTVVIGNTLYSIAQEYNISVQAIIEANPGIQAERLQIGQRICIPAEAPPERPCPGTLYTVQPGDTLLSLAREYSYTLDALIVANPGIDPDVLRVGQQICLPPAPGGGPFPCPGGSIYRIQPGDTLYSIANRFGIPFNELLAANQHLPDPDNLIVGNPLCIPR
ncbi:LysM peptidoglycan-binding domain-containing protein [Natronospora cellulosivora (SeqCode)]